jgi:tetratricopeptide (TPR) repeat protein
VKRQNTISFMEWIVWGWIGIFLLVGISTNGIFNGLSLHNASLYAVYEKPILYGLFLTILIFLWNSTHLLTNNIIIERRMLYGIASSVLCLVYLLSSFHADSPILAQFGVLISFMLVVFFNAGTYFIQYERIIALLPRVYIIFGYLIIIYGFLNLFGNAYLRDSLVFYEGLRIGSIFQYPNAYAVLLLTLWIAVLIEMTKINHRAVYLMYGLTLVPICVSFLLTLSRGALIVLPIIAVVTLLMFRLRQQIMIIVFSIISMGAALAIYSYLETKGTEVYQRIQQAASAGVPFETSSVFSLTSISGWAMLAIASIVMGGIVYIIHKFIEPVINVKFKKYASKNSDRFLPLLLAGVFIVGAIVVASDLITQFLPEVIRSRVESINFQTHSVYERLTMYRDAIDIWKENPVLGGGAGVWEAIYEQHQSYPYLSAQTHSYLTQLLIEVGIVGVIVYVAFILMIFVVFVRYYRIAKEEERSRFIFYFMTPITILLHALIDFEMSFLMYATIVFMCLGVMAGTQRQQILVGWNKRTKRNVRLGTSIIVIVLVVIVAVVSGRQLYAINQFEDAKEAGRTKQPVQQIVDPLQKGLSSAPGHPLLLQELIVVNYKLYEQTNDLVYLERAQAYMEDLNTKEPHYQPSVQLNYLIDIKKGERQKATEIMVDAIKQYPFAQIFYEQAVVDLSSQWEEARTKGTGNEGTLAEKILGIYKEMNRREQMVFDLPDTINLIRTFDLTNTVRLAAGQVAYYHGDYPKAIEILSKGIKDDLGNVVDRQLARYYLATLNKQGQVDETLHQRLIQADPEEEKKIVELLKTS